MCFLLPDFAHLHQAHSLKNTLQGHIVILVETYEAQTLEVSLVRGLARQIMTLKGLRQILGEQRWNNEVFACLCIHQSQSAEIELMNSEGSLEIKDNILTI